MKHLVQRKLTDSGLLALLSNHHITQSIFVIYSASFSTAKVENYGAPSENQTH